MEKYERALKIAVANNNTLTKTIKFWKSNSITLKHDLKKLKNEQKVLAQKTKQKIEKF